MDNKNAVTMFNFRTLRNPELLREEGKSKRFVFHPDYKSGVFFQAMSTKPPQVSKLSIMQTTANTFNALTAAQLKTGVTANFYEVAVYVAINKANLDAGELGQKINDYGLKPVDQKLEIILWDNLFFQMVTHQGFYEKEALIEVLVLNNLLKEYKISGQKDDFPTLAQAVTVLPVELFQKEPVVQEGQKIATNAKKVASVAVVTLSKKQIRTQNVLAAQKVIKALEIAQTEIEYLSKKHQKTAEKAYKLATQKYEEATAPLIEAYEKQYRAETQKILKATKPQDYNPSSPYYQPQIEYPVLPKFVFELAEPTDAEALQKSLSKESFTALQAINALKNIDSYTEITERIRQQITLQTEVIGDNTVFTDPVIVIAGVPILIDTEEPLPIEIPTPTVPPTNNATIAPSFIPKPFGIKQIGIADYKKVTTHVCCYVAGEVSHIENVMAREMRSKTTTRERIEEFTETKETEQETEKLTDSISTERFEMQTEVAKLLQEQKSFSANASFTAGWGSAATGQYTLGVGADYASNTSKEEANRQAITQAKDLTQRAMERIVTRIRKETVRKTTERFKEENSHDFDNRLGDKHVSGVYRFINAVYKNEVFNYGQRMMYEFLIPQPSKFHRLAMTETVKSTPAVVVLEKPIHPKDLLGNLLTSPAGLNNANYMVYVTNYGADVKPYPEEYKTFGKAFAGAKVGSNELFNDSTDLQIPQGYETRHAKIDIFAAWDTDRSNIHSFCVTVGNLRFAYATLNNIIVNINTEQPPYSALDKFSETIPVGYHSMNYLTLNIAITVKAQITPQAIAQWQLDTYDAIIKAYETKNNAYLASLVGVQTETQKLRDTNPGFFRDIEQSVLRKACISYLLEVNTMGANAFYTGNTVENYAISQTQTMENYGSLVKFMEQAFEWELISYNFYPFYWANKAEWSELYKFECNDPLFRNFMQAGMARVVVTVRPGFEHVVSYYMTRGKIWGGGQMPVLGDPLYLSITDELVHPKSNLKPESSWETIVPTSLIGLQSSGVAIKAEGLPCAKDCLDSKEEDITPNGEVLGTRKE